MLLRRQVGSALALAFFSLILVLPHAAGRQSSAGATPAPAGARMILLPRKVVAGAPATLAVLDVHGRLTPGVTVEFSGGARTTTDATGRAVFTAPAAPGVLLAHLPGRPGNVSTTVLPPPVERGEELRVTSYPRVVSLSDRFEVSGRGFQGAADSNRVSVVGHIALVVAASPMALVILPPPETTTGASDFSIESGGKKAGPLSITFIALELSAAKPRLLAGESGTLTVKVTGTTERLLIEARNLGCEVAEMPRGNPLRLVTTGGVNNIAQIDLVGRKAGDFLVSIKLVPGAAGLPDVEGARRQLAAAQRLAPAPTTERLGALITRLERDPQNFARVRDDLERILAGKPEGEYGRLVEAAWKALLNR